MDEGISIWIVGPSASGKSTLAKEVVAHFNKNKMKVQLIDGDVMRSELGGMFGYTKEDRMKVGNIYRAMACLLNKNGINVVVAAIAPYEEMRRKNRERIKKYIEISLDCPMKECIKRDPKGLYKRALAGEERFVIGIDEIYESPKNSDLIIDTYKGNVQDSAQKITDYIDKYLFS